MTDEGLTISKAADAAGLSVETIRYYQRIGLVNPPVKPVRGYRVYHLDDLNTLKFIKRSRKLGFSLDEIKSLLEIGESNCGEIRDQAMVKRDQINRQIEDLVELRNSLDQMISTCEQNSKAGSCPVVFKLKHDD